MGRGGKTLVRKRLRDMRMLPNGTFDWLEIYEPITYFPFSTRISLYKSRNILNNLIIILILMLESIKIKETAISFLKTSFQLT